MWEVAQRQLVGPSRKTPKEAYLALQEHGIHPRVCPSSSSHWPAKLQCENNGLQHFWNQGLVLCRWFFHRKVWEICGSFKMIQIHRCVLIWFSHVWIFGLLWTVAHQALLSLGFFRQEYCNGLPFPSLRGLPNPSIEPGSHVSCIGKEDLYQWCHLENLNVLGVAVNIYETCLIHLLLYDPIAKSLQTSTSHWPGGWGPRLSKSYLNHH